MISLQNLSPVIGVELQGVESVDALTSAEGSQTLRDALMSSRLVLVRRFKLEAGEQIEIIESLGMGSVLDERGNGQRWSWITNKPGAVAVGDVVDGTGSQLLWHADQEFTRYGPIRIISLYGVGEMGGSPEPTMFANMVNAAASLPDSLRSNIQGLRVLKTKEAPSGEYGTSSTEKMDRRNRLSDRTDGGSVFLGSEHGIIERLPDSGEEYLTPSHMMTSHVVGWSDDRSDELFNELDGWAYREENIYKHNWEAGDFVIWDNVALQHARGQTSGVGSSERTLRRVTADPINSETRLSELVVA